MYYNYYVSPHIHFKDLNVCCSCFLEYIFVQVENCTLFAVYSAMKVKVSKKIYAITQRNHYLE